MVYVPNMSLWVESMSSLNLCEPYDSYSTGVMPDKISTVRLRWKWEVNERLCIKEVGVDLELCVPAHENDVDLIIGASSKNNYPLGIISSYIWDLMFCNRGPGHIVLLWSRFSDKLNYLSFAHHFTCQASILLYLRVLPPWYLEIIMELHNFLWVLHQVLPSHWFQFFTGSELLNTQRHR